MEHIRRNYRIWLREARAMEEQSLAQSQAMAAGTATDADPALKDRIDRHLAETGMQKSGLRTLLARHDTDRDCPGEGRATPPAGMSPGDPVEAHLAAYAFEHLEIARYLILLTAARMLGDLDGVAILERSLAEEQAMADWLRDHMDPATRARLQDEGAGPH